MLSEEELKQITQIMAEQLKPIKEEMSAIKEEMNERFDKVNERFDKVDERLNDIEEEAKITRTTTNAIGEWVETYFKHQYPYPVDKEIG